MVDVLERVNAVSEFSRSAHSMFCSTQGYNDIFQYTQSYSFESMKQSYSVTCWCCDTQRRLTEDNMAIVA